MNKIIHIILFLIVATVLALVIVIGIDKQEQETCHKYQRWAKEYPLFYMTQLDKEMCDNWSIQVDAPVK
jgi:hypothetical protein